MNEAQIVDRPEEAVPATNTPPTPSSVQWQQNLSPPATERNNCWIAAARFLLAWIIPVVLTLYLKWYALQDADGFARVARSIGFAHLRPRDVIGFFRMDVLIGFCVIPFLTLLFARYMHPRLTALVVGAGSLGLSILLAIQLRSLVEVGRYVSLEMMWIALQWGLQEPSANVGYLSMRGIAALAVGCAATVAALIWASRAAKNVASSKKTLRSLRIGGELYLLCAIAVLAIGWKSSVPRTPYHESTLLKSVVSLWRENAVDTGEFAAFDFDHNKQKAATLPSLSPLELVAKYRELTKTPERRIDPRYFGKQAGANVIFFVLETTPSEFLSVDDGMAEFPNLARLKEHSFLAERHYTTLPVTDSALFSVFTSWYPIDSLEGPSGFSTGLPPDLIVHMNAAGVQTAVFTPVNVTSAQAMYKDVGFQQLFQPSEVLKDFYNRPGWRDRRIANDLTTLGLAKFNMEKWMDSHQRFLAAFMPQVGHFPYADAYPPDSTENLRERSRAIIKLEDSWLGQIMELLQEHGQLDNTIIVVVGDHGRRNKRENPNLRLGTIDETAFHVPLFIYAPRALAEPQHIPWITSHIDIAPTVLDLLGVKDGRDSEQGLPIWQSDLAQRTTFFFAQPTFGADGYETDSRFYMWHYFSDSVYANSQAEFDMRNFIPRAAPLANDITSKISTMVALEKQWHQKFAQPYPTHSEHP